MQYGFGGLGVCGPALTHYPLKTKAAIMIVAIQLRRLGQVRKGDFRLEGWVGACCPEIETCPRTFACSDSRWFVSDQRVRVVDLEG